MADRWLGQFLEKMDALDLWKDTTLNLTTDHGHLLGDFGYWAKNYTRMELHGATPFQHVQGKSLVHLLDHDELHHDAVLYGYSGKDVNLTDGRYTYCRQAAQISLVYHHTAMPVGAINHPKLYERLELE